MQETAVSQLSPLELGAWRGFLRVHAGLVRELNGELEAAHALPLTHYEVLLYLESAPEGRLRMSELAESVLLSQSGVTRLVDRLERAGLVERTPCAEDRRVMYAAITHEGRGVLEEARPTLLDGVRSRFLSRVEDEELAALADAWERIRPGVTS